MNFEVNEINVHAKPIKCLKIAGSSIEQRNPTHTIVLLDTSGSMDEGNKLNNVKKSLTFLLKFLQKSDYISLVTFSSISEILIENINCTNEYMEAFRYTIQTLKAEGGTNLSAGLLNVKNILQRSTNTCKTGLIILTDGHTNEGLTRSDDLLRIIEAIKVVNPSISITAIGYNEDHNANLLKDVATNGNGSYNIVNNIEEVATVFGDILGGLMSVVVQNVSVTYVSSWKNLNMYKTKEKNGNSILEIGDVCGESETILLFENTDMSTVTVSGVIISSLQSVQNTITWTPTEYSSNKESYMMAYIRNSIAYILNNLTNLNKEETLSKVNEMKEFLNSTSVQHNPLTKMLKDEINSIENQLNESVLDTTNNLQTSVMLGLGRGLSRARHIPRYNTNENNTNEYDTMIDQFQNMNMSMTPFANRVQRQLTQQMTTMTAGDPEE
uniref:VWFA domain-containing protein n=1 Tax=viral metagenome TaxID=1070528 RepID=A0A6C0D6I2_9ZZZZ